MSPPRLQAAVADLEPQAPTSRVSVHTCVSAEHEMASCFPSLTDVPGGGHIIMTDKSHPVWSSFYILALLHMDCHFLSVFVYAQLMSMLT